MFVELHITLDLNKNYFITILQPIINWIMFTRINCVNALFGIVSSADLVLTDPFTVRGKDFSVSERVLWLCLKLVCVPVIRWPSGDIK